MGFVLLGLRETLYVIERYFFLCRKRKASTLHPMMSVFPVERLGYRHRPFSNRFEDYFAPFSVTICGRSEKRAAFCSPT